MSRLTKTQHGEATFIDPGSDVPFLELKTLQCCHCGGHYAVQPGSGKIRGFCTRCMGPVCGPDCAECVPTDLYLTNLEKGRDPLFRPVVVPTSFSGE